jgi:hypothetical protein
MDRNHGVLMSQETIDKLFKLWESLQDLPESEVRKLTRRVHVEARKARLLQK